MGSIFVNDRDGKTHKLDAQKGSTFMEIIRDAGLDIEAACGGCCACATCHIYIDHNWFDMLPIKEGDEEAMLDQTFHILKTSRLGCQIEYEDKYEGINLTLAPE